MSKRWIAVGFIGALVVLNIWKWWPASGDTGKAPGSAPVSGEAGREELGIRSLPPDGEVIGPDPRRNPFAEVGEEEPGPELSPEMVRLGPDGGEEGSEASPENPEGESDEADSRIRRKLKKYRLHGVVVRPDQDAVALMAKGSRTFPVRSGETLEGGVVVESVSRKSVVLKGPGGQAGRTLRLGSN